MFGRRIQDLAFSTDDSPHAEMRDSSLTVFKLKDIISMLLKTIRFFTENKDELNGEVFKIQLDQNLARLKKTFDVHELTEIEESLKKLIFRQRDAERVHHQNQHAEYAKIIANLIEEINDLNQKNRQGKTQHDSEVQSALSQKVEDLEARLRKAQEENLTDSLTQVFNRRAFDRQMQNEVAHSKLLGRGFGLVLFDIDRFKSVNDTHGHQAGDRLLTAIAQQVKTVFRVDDFVARYGGDEFAAILHCPTIDSVQYAAERLRNVIARTAFHYEKEDGRIETLQITISVGVAWYRDGDTPESLINRADQCLLLAKRRNRNRMFTQLDLERTHFDDVVSANTSNECRDSHSNCQMKGVS